jgi:hypothetical protein
MMPLFFEDLTNMVWFLIIELFLLASVIVLYKFHWFSACALFVILLILLPSALMGAFIVKKVYRPLLPYAVYSSEQVRKEKIKCTGYEDGFYILSNGKKVRNPKSPFFRIIFSVSFLFGSMIVFFPALFVAKKITHKYAPEVYELLKPKPTQIKNPFDHEKN